jgi:hypothetical protein
MTTVVVWQSARGDGVTAIYVASDSRFTWAGATMAKWDHGRKLYLAKASADMFAYVGDVLFPSIVLGQLTEAMDCGGAFPEGATSDERHAFVLSSIERSHNTMPCVPGEPVTILHASKDEQSGRFRLWEILEDRDNKVWRSSEIELPTDDRKSGLIGVYGSGSKSFRTAYKKATTGNQGPYSRTIFQTLWDCAEKGGDPMTGGPVQCAVITRNGDTKPVGVFDGTKRYVFGLETRKDLRTNGIEWRDRNFNFVDDQSGQPQTRSSIYVRDRSE